jgi:hypothetical protein
MNPEYRSFEVRVLPIKFWQKVLAFIDGKTRRSAVDARGDRYLVLFDEWRNENFKARFYELHNNPLTRRQRYAVVPF